MKIRSFHHPDLCPTVIRRRAVEQMLDLMVETVAILSTRGWRLGMSCYPSQAAYHSSVSRLRKKGLIVQRRGDGKPSEFALTPAGEARVSDVCRHAEPWPKHWNGIWYQLAYDIPEEDRRYRNILREFLKRLRMGCLQKSVWVTHRDIRPEYDDLVQATRVDLHSFLFETRTVLGRSSADVVRQAWDMERVEDIQRWYMEVYEDNLSRAASGDLTQNELLTLVREELSAYVTAMSEDPLLPKSLWPSGYAGKKAWRFHRRFTRALAKLL